MLQALLILLAKRPPSAKSLEEESRSPLNDSNLRDKELDLQVLGSLDVHPIDCLDLDRGERLVVGHRVHQFRDSDLPKDIIEVIDALHEVLDLRNGPLVHELDEAAQAELDEGNGVVMRELLQRLYELVNIDSLLAIPGTKIIKLGLFYLQLPVYD